MMSSFYFFFFFSSRRRHTRLQGDWSSDVCSSDLDQGNGRERKDHHQFEIVDVADDRSLRSYDLVERRASAGGPWAPCLQHGAVVEYVIECRDMACDGRVIDQIVSDQQIRHHRYADTGPDVTGEVVQAGAVGALLGLKRGKRDGSQRHEQKTKPSSLDEAGYRNRPLQYVRISSTTACLRPSRNSGSSAMLWSARRAECPSKRLRNRSAASSRSSTLISPRAANCRSRIATPRTPRSQPSSCASFANSGN